MKFQEKLHLLRKEKGFSQEELAEQLDISRQAVSKWESGVTHPETEKLIQLSKLFDVTLDSLLKEGPIVYNGQTEQEEDRWQSERTQTHHATPPPQRRFILDYEYKSKRTLFGLPLVHINTGWGVKRAKGILAIGNIATGIFSIGLLSIGLFSLGVLALGLFLALGVFSVGALSLGSIAIGGFALGAIAIGYIAMGAVSIGVYATGALAVASRVAIGDHAHAYIAVGQDVARGTHVFLSSSTRQFVDIDTLTLSNTIQTSFPNISNFVYRFLMLFVG